VTPNQQRFVQEYLVDLNATQAAIRAGCEVREWSLGLDYYVYLLIDPLSGSIFYVGKGKKRRCFHHEKQRHNLLDSNPKKITVIRDIVSRGLSVTVRLIGWQLTEADAYALERNLIEAIGKDRLTNAANGQFTEGERNLAFAKDRLRHVIPFSRWTAVKRSDFEVDLYWQVVNGFQNVIDRETAVKRSP